MKTISKHLRKQIKDHKVAIYVDESTLVCQCRRCRVSWYPMLMSGGRYKRGFWKCPNGCSDN